jgi:hypothetical protein
LVHLDNFIGFSANFFRQSLFSISTAFIAKGFYLQNLRGIHSQGNSDEWDDANKVQASHERGERWNATGADIRTRTAVWSSGSGFLSGQEWSGSFPADDTVSRVLK